MHSSWRKVENENGFPYYINEATNQKQWEHPKFAAIKQGVDNCNYIKYATYRVASKLRNLQHSLYMDEVPLSIIAGVFERHRLGVTESALRLEPYDLEAVLSDIYFAANKQNHTNIDIDFATELMLNFLFNVYDKERQGKIQVCSTKLLLAILSNCKLAELYHFIFTLCADHNNCVTRLRLQVVLSKLADITACMHEDVSFGHHLVNSAIEDCFYNSPGLVGISENNFLAWFGINPQLLSWIPTVFRMKAAEPIVHAAKCSVCKITPLVGLRYRCIKCTRYTQCQLCFLTGRVSHSHKLNHPMREYSAEDNSKEITHALVKKLYDLIRCSAKLNRSTFPVDAIETAPISRDKDNLLQSANDFIGGNVDPLSSPEAQLHVIIRQLELQNKEFQQQIILCNGSNDKEMKRYLEEHRLHIAAQIQKLKVLKIYLQTTEPKLVNEKQLCLQSTPMVPSGKNFCRDKGLDMLSPIAQNLESTLHYKDRCSRETKDSTESSSLQSYSLRDISTWIGGRPNNSASIPVNIVQGNNTADKIARHSPIREMHNDLDEVLLKLQQILANNFTDESLRNGDNGQLKHAVTEVEGMLTSLIDGVEHSRTNSAQTNVVSRNRETVLY